MESFVALTRFQAGRPRFKGEERQRELVWRQMVVCFPWQQQRGESLVSASPPVDRWSTARRWAAPSSQEPELPARLREETGGLWGSYRPGRSPLRATHPDTLQRYRLVSCWGLSGLEAAARACLAQSESKFNMGKSEVAHQRQQNQWLTEGTLWIRETRLPIQTTIPQHCPPAKHHES